MKIPIKPAWSLTADDAVISKVEENSDNTDVVQECEVISGPSDIIKAGKRIPTTPI